jgi:hypothetical protein
MVVLCLEEVPELATASQTLFAREAIKLTRELVVVLQEVLVLLHPLLCRTIKIHSPELVQSLEEMLMVVLCLEEALAHVTT